MNAFRFDVMVPIRVRCSAPECLEHVELPTLPMVLLDVACVPRVDRAEIAAALPAGWKVGAMRRRAGVLVMPGEEPVQDVAPVPMAFCPVHTPGKG